MPGYIEDRWWTKRPDPTTGKKRKTARYGQGKRYRVAGIPGVRDRSFTQLVGPDGAKAWLARAQHESTRGEFIDPRDGTIPLGEYIETEWWPNQRGDPASLLTIKGRVSTHITPHLGTLSLNAVKTPQLRTWLATLSDVIGPSTIGEVWTCLSRILQSAVDDERITKNYCRSQTTVRPPTRPERKARAWPRDRVLAVRAALPERFHVLVDLGVGAGLRQGEAFGVSLDDVDEEGGVLHVRRQVKKIGAKQVFALPKGGKTRDVPLPPRLLSRIKEHLECFPASKVTLPWGNPALPTTEKEAKERAPRTFELITTAHQGGAIRRESWDQRAWKPALAAVGLIPPPTVTRRPRQSRPGCFQSVVKYVESRELGFHSLRHTFASVHLDAGESIVSVSGWLGHADPSITLRIYAHMMPAADNRGRAAMDAWFEGEA